MIAFDPLPASTGRFPALALLAARTIPPQLRVGQAGAAAIAEHA